MRIQKRRQSLLGMVEKYTKVWNFHFWADLSPFVSQPRRSVSSRTSTLPVRSSVKRQLKQLQGLARTTTMQQVDGGPLQENYSIESSHDHPPPPTSPSTLTEVALSGWRPPAPRWTGSGGLAAGCRSSAPWRRRRWSSWGRWWWCSWSAAAAGEAGSPAVSCSGARCCGARPPRSADSAGGPGRWAAAPPPGWSGGLSRSARTRCTCLGKTTTVTTHRCGYFLEPKKCFLLKLGKMDARHLLKS